MKKQKCPDFTVRATQTGPQSESIFPPKHTLRRTCTSVYKWVDAIETDAGMPHNQVYCSTNLRNSKFYGSFFIPICVGRENDNERILAYNIGLAIHDINFATHIYQMLRDNEGLLDIDMHNPVDKFWI